MLVELTRADANRAERHYAFEQVGLGTRRDYIVRQLVENGLDLAASEELVAEADGVRIDTLKGQAGRRMMYGLLWFAAGVGLSIFSYDNATRSGSGYSTVFWGMMLIGGVRGLSGFIDSVRYDGQRVRSKERSFTDQVVRRCMLVCVAGGAAYGAAWGLSDPDGPIVGLIIGLVLFPGLGALLAIPVGILAAGLLSLVNKPA